MIRRVWENEFPTITSPDYGQMTGAADLVPKPVARIPILVTGQSRQSLDWIAREADGWITYPRPLKLQAKFAEEWNPDADPEPIHLGFRGGRRAVLAYLEGLRQIGVNHVILNLKYGRRPADEVLEEIGEKILPQFGVA